MSAARRNRIDRIVSHLDRVVGPPEEILQRIEEAEKLVSSITEALAPPVPRPPLLPPPPLPAGRSRELKRCVQAFYTVLRRRYGDRVAEEIVREAAENWRR